MQQVYISFHVYILELFFFLEQGLVQVLNEFSFFTDLFYIWKWNLSGSRQGTRYLKRRSTYFLFIAYIYTDSAEIVTSVIKYIWDSV